jgi:hypothetical protein
MTSLEEIRKKLAPQPEVKLRAIIEAMDQLELTTPATLNPDEHDAAVLSNGFNHLTRKDLARLIGMAYRDTELCYRLAKMLVDLNRP